MDSYTRDGSIEQRPKEFTIGTYNILHPFYALKWNEEEGIDKVTKKSNWNQRCARIGEILESNALDVYLLQEIGEAQLNDLKPYIADAYALIHFTHPARTARDGVAICCRRSTFKVTSSYSVPFEAVEREKDGQHYMCAAVVLCTHKSAPLKRFAFASTHLYTKGSVEPQETLLRALALARGEDRVCDYVVWGGDCNRRYPPMGKGKGKGKGKKNQQSVDEELSDYAWSPLVRFTRKNRHTIDWLFCSKELGTPSRDATTERFWHDTCTPIPSTGFCPSDHYGVAMTVRIPDVNKRGREEY